MRRLLILIGLGFVVLTGSSIVGVELAERGARERRAERFARSVLDSARTGGTRHLEALGESEIGALETRSAALAKGATLMRLRSVDDRWELAYCLSSGEPFQLWVPDPNPRRRARLLFAAPDDAPTLCAER